MENLLKFLPRLNDDVGGGVLLSYNQDFQEKFLAENERGKIKLVLIALSPYGVSKHIKNLPIVQPVHEKLLDEYFKLCADNGANPVAVVLPVKQSVRKNYNDYVLKAFSDTINKVVKKYKTAFINLLDVKLADKFFDDAANLTFDGEEAVGALLVKKLYLKNILSHEDICAAAEDFFEVLEKNFPLERDFSNNDNPLIQHVFCIMAYNDFNRLSKTLPKETCMDLMVKVFSELTYSYLVNLAKIFPKDDYNELEARIFNMTAEKISRKEKIKVGFYFGFSSHWCGDDVYNVFANDKRFEPTVFIPTEGWYNTEFDSREFREDLKKYRARGLNVFEMKRTSLDIPKQDILFRLRPYPEATPPAFRLTKIKVKETLLVYIPYSFFVIIHGSAMVNYPLFNVLWKNFFPSTVMLERYKKLSRLGLPRGIFSGYPKLDIFLKKDLQFKFDWKMTQPNAKKIIWAPHWSIGRAGIHNATFQWNYKFMYEFAKNHPEISWVVKPHSGLFKRAVDTKVFPSNEALNDYFKKWDELPNARFYTGSYYEGIFATSDGMIQDCCSFIAEYQYLNKPMIYLTRTDGIEFDELGDAVLGASYLVDGKNLKGIAALMQRVFIDGDDYKAAERKKVFDKYLNYPKANGMLASEFIFKSIADELKPE